MGTSNQQLHYIELGSGPPLLLIHGLFDSLESWQKLIPLLSDHFKIYAIDLPGFGKSPLPTSWTRSIYGMIQSAVAFLEEKEGRPVSLLGNSMGGGIALGIAEALPERIDRIVLLNPYGLPSLPIAAKGAQGRIRGRILPYLLRPSALRRCAKGILKRSLYNPDLVSGPMIERVIQPFSSIQQRKNLFRFLKGISSEEIQSIDDRLPTIAQAVLILWGEKDGWLSDAHWERLLDRLRDGKVIKIPDCGHLPHLEKPKEVAEAIIQFLRNTD
ncbi:MAG: alpha/beta hydrolase [Nitrospira sp.]